MVTACSVTASCWPKMTREEYLVLIPCHRMLYVTQKLVCEDVWFIDLAPTVKEIQYFMLSP